MLKSSRDVIVKWDWIYWDQGKTWTKDVKPQLDKCGLTEEQLKHCVYVIRAYDFFAIDYKKGISPVLYIGQGDLKNRLLCHKGWLQGVRDLVGQSGFEIAICIPMVHGSYVHKEMEAALIEEFEGKFGSIPLRNRRHESYKKQYSYKPVAEFRKALMIGRGVRYHWAVRPMRSNGYHKNFRR